MAFCPSRTAADARRCPDRMSANEITRLAQVDFRNDHRVFGIKTEDRLSHIYIIGKTGTGEIDPS